MSDFPRQVRGAVYTVPFTAATLSSAAASDLFFVTNASAGRLAINEIRLGQFSEFADAQSELLSLLLMTGTTSVVVAGSSLPVQNVRQHTRASTAAFTVGGPTTTVASTASAILRLADSFNVAAGWYYRPDIPLNERIVIEASQKMFLRVSVANDPITINGTITLQTLGIG